MSLSSVIKEALSPESKISSKRVVFFTTTLLNVFVDVAIVIMAFKIAILRDTNNVYAIQALKQLIMLSLYLLGSNLVITGILAWQDIRSVIPLGFGNKITELESTVKAKISDAETKVTESTSTTPA